MELLQQNCIKFCQLLSDIQMETIWKILQALNNNALSITEINSHSGEYVSCVHYFSIPMSVRCVWCTHQIVYYAQLQSGTDVSCVTCHSSPSLYEHNRFITVTAKLVSHYPGTIFITFVSVGGGLENVMGKLSDWWLKMPLICCMKNLL